jgi:hypothetical protein
MVSRYHWTFAAYDTNGVGSSAVMPQLDLPIPAGATMKRFLTRGNLFLADDGGTAYDRVIQRYMTYDVDIVSGQYFPRNLYRTKRRIPLNAVALFDSLADGRVHTGRHAAGDLELGFNQKVSYGTADGGGFTVRLSSSMNRMPGSLELGNWKCTCEFRALYYL